MRRIHVDKLTPGDLPLAADQSHHLRDVLRLTVGEAIELFDSAGVVGNGVVVTLSPVVVHVESVTTAQSKARITVASAVPKGDRADWMIEKLSEIGVQTFVPLRTERSVVHPEGAGKLDRWKRIAIESAKQCKRVGVMQIAPLVPLEAIMKQSAATGAIFFSTGTAPPLHEIVGDAKTDATDTTALIGPEGGWSDAEEARLRSAGLTAASLGPTILRIETAAVLAAGLLMLLRTETNRP